MKSRYTSLLFFFVAWAMMGMFTGCSEDDNLPNGGKPLINFIRVTRPAASDSLIAKAGQGSMIAIMGQNLQEAREIWFNNRQATLTPTFITNTSIITRVPAEIPTQISNKMKIIFANGDSLLHDFTVDISEPVITGMMSEYVNAGQVATITGNYFYAPLKVFFKGANGPVEGEVMKIEEEVLQVTVPEGAQPGPISIATNFGQSASAFWFRDNRNIIASFDGTTGGLWHGPAFIVDADPGIPAISNKFIRINMDLGPWQWFEMYVGPKESDIALENKNIPADAFANPQKYSLKFEINTLASLKGAEIRMHMGNGEIGGRDKIYYIWKPNIHTEGDWQTVSIPFEDFWTDNAKFAYSPNGYTGSFHFSGPLAVKANFGLDNMRVVPN
jgi:Surface glycan-binding protein B xyloglucan binding domain